MLSNRTTMVTGQKSIKPIKETSTISKDIYTVLSSYVNVLALSARKYLLKLFQLIQPSSYHHRSMQDAKEVVINEVVGTTASNSCFISSTENLQSESGSRGASSSISLPNLEENGEKIRFQQIKAQAEAGSKDASSSISIPNLVENGEKIEIINLVSSDEEVDPVRNGSSDTLPSSVPINKVPKVQNPPAHPTQLENMKLLIDLLERMSRINSEFFQIFLEPKDEHCYVPTAHHKDWPKILTWSQMKTAYEQGYNYLSEVTKNEGCSKRLFKKLWCFPHPSVFP